MKFPEDQIDELKKLYPNIQIAEEGGSTFFFIPKVTLPNGCEPNKLDVLFCPTAHRGYASRLYFEQKFSGGPSRNWNGEYRLLDKTWYAISWNINQNQRLIQMIRSHLDAFRI